MNLPLIILVVSQLLFSASDLIGRTYMMRHGFSVALFTALWFWIYSAIRIIATFGQLYVLSSIELGKTMTLFGVVGIVIANTLGILVLKEVITPLQFIGTIIAIVAFLVIILS